MSITQRPLRLFEIDDQPFMPSYARGKVQELLMAFWTHRMPYIQPSTPAELAADIILNALKQYPDDTEFVICDFASGAGGPTPMIERVVNTVRVRQGQKPLKFLLSDIKPNLDEWRKHKASSQHIDYVEQSVDAANPPPEVVSGGVSGHGKKIFRLYCLSFHHFDDPLAAEILRSSMETADGFAIIELVSRTWSSLLLVGLSLPTALLMVPLWFPLDFGMLFLVYICPLVLFVFVFDGLVSALRIRTFREIMALAGEVVPSATTQKVMGIRQRGWSFEYGDKVHTWPIGYINWIVGIKRVS